MAGRSHEGRLEEGRRLLAAAALVDTRSVAARLAKFKKAHQQYESLTGKVDKAERPYDTQIGAIGEADAAQDGAVEALAKALVGDGGARTNPFKVFGAPSPSELAAKGYAAEAKDALKLVKAVRGKKDASKATTAAAAALEKAAKSVQSAMVGIEAQEAARRRARRTRCRRARVGDDVRGSPARREGGGGRRRQGARDSPLRWSGQARQARDEARRSSARARRWPDAGWRHADGVTPRERGPDVGVAAAIQRPSRRGALAPCRAE